MNIKEIILKENVAEEELYAVIEEYIFERKDRKVVINNLKGLNMQNQIHQVVYVSRINQAFDAFNVAAAWLMKNKYNDKKNN